MKRTIQKTDKVSMHEVSKEELKRLYGKIDLKFAKKEFASAKCCMCCK